MVGGAAPGFELVDQDGELRRLADYRGQWLVLYFYPKDDTPGCTTEACNFRDDVPRLRRMETRVLGVSVDSRNSHAAFAEEHHLPFPLLSDRDGEVARAYGSYVGLGPIRFAKRNTFIIDPDGSIARIYRKVKPATHSDEVVTAVAELQESDG
ncbi:peroxiredoxin [Thiohalorhabdus sp.]|uniref:peroxiredoxin n=1 Tax=Thiohalorhabdus sp. TaxID=3094134 RepID=UPI002FC2C76F